MSVLSEDSGSQSRPCGNNCAWQWNFDIGDWEAVHGCADPLKWCDQPSMLADPAATVRAGYACTSCYSSKQLTALSSFQPKWS